jgi:small acid-soluble spore protein D (minor alpha/beta-type SASP)
MARNKLLNPNARGALNRLKMETANEVGVTLKDGYNGDLKSKDAGQIGGNMVKKMVEDYEAKAESSGTATTNNKYNSSNS